MGTVLEISLQNENEFKNILNVINSYSDLIVKETNIINSVKPYDKVSLNDDFSHLLKKGRFFYELSGGRFDITTATITSKYGFPEGPFKIPSKKEIDDALKIYGWNNLILKNNKLLKKSNLKIDTGAYSKGFIVDKAVQYLKKKNIKSGLINAGGDLFALGNKNGKKWKIAIQYPGLKDKYLSIVKLENAALATSGNYERFFIQDGKKIIHIFDGKTGETANNYQSVSVIAKDTETADGLATVYFLLKPDEIKLLCKKNKTPVLLYTLDNKLVKLCGWKNFE
jgi:thiamine biosynthesis lipoprotein